MLNGEVAVDLAADRAIPEGRKAGVDRRVPRAARRSARTKAARRAAPRATASDLAEPGRQARESRGRRPHTAAPAPAARTWSASAAASSAPRASGAANSASDQTSSAATSESLEFDCSASAVYGIGEPRRKRGPLPSAACRLSPGRSRLPRRNSAGDGRQVEEDRRGVGGGRSSHSPRQGSAELERDVGEVVDGPVGVAESGCPRGRRPRRRSARRG